MSTLIQFKTQIANLLIRNTRIACRRYNGSGKIHIYMSNGAFTKVKTKFTHNPTLLADLK